MVFIVAVDGSDESERALHYAIDVTERMGAPLRVVHVVDPDVYAETAGEPVSNLAEADRLLVSTVERAEQRGERVITEAESDAEDRGVAIETDTLYGDPENEIARYAEEIGAEGIFVGHRGLSEKAERMLGSVAKGLVERAAVPVTVVR